MANLIRDFRQIGEKKYKIHSEQFSSAVEVVETCKSRKITDSGFDDIKTRDYSSGWYGVKSYNEALEFMRTGYQPTVEKLKTNLKVHFSGTGKRISFANDIVGYAPVVPLAMKGVPQCMINTTYKPMKAKVIDICWDLSVSCATKSEAIIEAGSKILAAIISMEQQGYRCNLYAMQGYSDSASADVLLVKIKDARQPLDLKRISFPLTHTAFFRVIGFDWYSKFPGGKYRCGYGYPLSVSLDADERRKLTEQLLGKNAVYFSCGKTIYKDEAYFEEVMKKAGGKR